MRERWTVVMAILLIVIMMMQASTPAAVAANEGEITLTIVVPAVQEPSGKGALIPVSITIKPGGNGDVTISAGGEVGQTTETSIRQAVVVASVLAGYDWRMFDYSITFLNSSSVTGPSASAAVATGVYLALTGSPALSTFENNVTMTGAISPLGLYSTIGGVPEKCAAAAEAGRLFLYPLANYIPTIPGCTGQALSVAGIPSAIEALLGIGINAPLLNISMPREFNVSMMNASMWMSGLARSILSQFNVSNLTPTLLEVYNEAMKAINESAETRETHPYVSASRAFYALYNTFYLQYLYNLTFMGNTGLVNSIQDEAQRLLDQLLSLESNLTTMPDEGSALYVEFLGIAYDRIASAEASLQDISVVASANPQEAIKSLAYAKARIYSIMSWIDTALAVRNLEPYLTADAVRNVSLYFGDFVHISADYAISIARYMINSYDNEIDKAILQRSIKILEDVVSKGDAYTANGNYIAALGFYREALAESMNSIFSIVTTGQNFTKTIYEGYLEEVLKLYNYMSGKLVLYGFTPGLAPAYLDYAIYFKNKGSLADAVDMGRNALASVMIWYIYVTVEHSSTVEMGSNPQLLPAPVGEHGIWVLIGIAAILGFIIAFAALASYYSRVVKEVVSASSGFPPYA